MGCSIYSLWFLNSSSIFKFPYLFSLAISPRLFHLYHSFLLEFLIHGFYTISVFPPYTSRSYCHLFVSPWITVPISSAVSSSLLIQPCSNVRRLISATNLCAHYGKFFVSPHIWFPVHWNRRLWKVDWFVYNHKGEGRAAKSGKCFKGSWESFKGATQWKRALSKTNVKVSLICDK